MIRTLLVFVALSLVSVRSPAGETVVRLNVQPMAAPRPALKYQLLPEVRELNPGNPAQGYLRCFAEQRYFFFSKVGVSEREGYRAMPLAELPADKLRNYGGHALKQADWSARLDSLDWQVVPRVQTEGMGLVLPELEPLRVLAAALQVRFRGQVAGKHFDEAVDNAKTMLMLARHLGEYPTEAANLIGLAIAHMTLDTLEEMLQQPSCPNLYWALTDLPRPLVEIRKGVQGDCTLVATDLKALRDDAVMNDEELEKFVSRLSGLLGFAREQAGELPRNMRTALAGRVKDKERVRAARRRLVEAGGAKDVMRNLYQVHTFSPLQVILLDEKRAYEVRRDEEVKLLSLEPYQIDALTSSESAGQSEEALLAELRPHVIKVRRQQARVEQRIALLRHVEALRLFAAAHGDKLPEKLADLPVPLPVDPFTGKAFGYRVEAGSVQLLGTPPRGEEKNSAYNVRYEVTLVGKNDSPQRTQRAQRKAEARK
jgi:hypothetical protein